VRPSRAGAAGHNSLAMVRACDEELELQPDRASRLGHGALGCRGILRSSVVSMYELGLVRHQGR
jgi:hypothetical protein